MTILTTFSMYELNDTLLYIFLNSAMVIGFTEKSKTVSESTALIGINVAATRSSDRLYPITVQHNEQRSTAVVGSLVGDSFNSDIRFGVRQSPNDPLIEETDLQPGQTTLQLIMAVIVQDLIIEPEECFTLQIFFTGYSSAREPLVTCNADDSSTNYFCEHTVCIEDDDGIYKYIYAFLLLMLLAN